MGKERFKKRALELASEDGRGLGARLAREFGISRTAASNRLRALLKAGLIEAHGERRGRVYKLAILVSEAASYRIKGLSEEDVWRELVAPVVAELPENARDIWHYGVTEMVNNAIDHSGSEVVEVRVERDALQMHCWVIDHGEGIFRRIQLALGLYDPRDSLIELAKGKFTTDPDHHTGEGIFFSSKVFECFQIHSRGLVFAHDAGKQDVMVEQDGVADDGTVVFMALRNDAGLTLQKVMDEFAAPEEYSFSRTIVPVRLAVHEGEKLVSRSQAKRITFRFERFENVILDFSGVAEIGQAFADELFRVFQKSHPSTILTPINMTRRVEAMLQRVTAGR